MATQFPGLQAAHQEFIARQKIFFVASATASSHVIVSPRGTDLFRVIDASSVLYLDKTGSGNETAAHIRAGGRITMMFVPSRDRRKFCASMDRVSCTLATATVSRSY